MTLFVCCRPLYHRCIVQVHFRLVTLFTEQLSATTSVGLFVLSLKQTTATEFAFAIDRCVSSRRLSLWDRRSWFQVPTVK